MERRVVKMNDDLSVTPIPPFWIAKLSQTSYNLFDKV
jgi:hypothetical protein